MVDSPTPVKSWDFFTGLPYLALGSMRNPLFHDEPSAHDGAILLWNLLDSYMLPLKLVGNQTKWITHLRTFYVPDFSSFRLQTVQRVLLSLVYIFRFINRHLESRERFKGNNAGTIFL